MGHGYRQDPHHLAARNPAGKYGASSGVFSRWEDARPWVVEWQRGTVGAGKIKIAVKHVVDTRLKAHTTTARFPFEEASPASAAKSHLLALLVGSVTHEMAGLVMQAYIAILSQDKTFPRRGDDDA